jgi:hypothetical protein
VVRSTLSFGGVELAEGIYLAFETAEKCLTPGAGRLLGGVLRVHRMGGELRPERPFGGGESHVPNLGLRSVPRPAGLAAR